MHRIFLIAAVVLSLTCLLVHAQVLGAQAGGMRGFDPNAARHDVSGSVVNGVTGEPIPRALVQIFGPYQRSAFSDAQGNFHFEGVPEGQVMFMARKPGFFNSQELARGGGPPRSMVKITSDTTSMVLKLTPEGIVTGTITGEEGEPLESVNVQLKRQVVTNGRKQWEERSQALTDEDGQFRVANLVPGTYYLLAAAVRRRTPSVAAAQSGYVPTYYPGAPDLSSAGAIEVRGGQTMQLDFRLRSQPLYEVSGAVLGMPPGARGAEMQLMNRSGEPLGFNNGYFSRDGAFGVKLPAGSYTIRASTFDPTERALTASATFTVAGNVSNLRLVLQPSPSIPIVVRTDFTKQQSTSTVYGGVGTVSFKEMPARYASVQLNSMDGRSGGFSSFAGGGENPVFELQNVAPGRYTAQITPNGPWYVQSATYGQTDLLREEMVVTQGGDARPIEITLRDDGGAITGSVMSDNVTVPAMVLAVAERRSAPPQPLYASENGFAIFTLAPGDYLLFAFDSTDGLEYSNRDALEPYVSQATRVSVSSNSKANITLTLIKRGEL